MDFRSGSIPETLPLEIRRLVVFTCQRFEWEWKIGGHPAIEPRLTGLSPGERPVVLTALIALEARLRAAAGDRPTLAEYAGRFPDDAGAIEAAFASIDRPPDPPAPGGEEGVAASMDRTELTSTRSGTQEPTLKGGEPGAGADATIRRLGRYEVLRVLGKGSFGRVYLARDGELGREVAIKVPTAQALARPGQLEALLAEARLAASLRHPAIVGVYDVGRDGDGTAFIVLEYVEGVTLAALLKEGRVDPVRLAGLVARIAEAVHLAHKAGMVHRDLKPSNIMIGGDGEPRVADFGLAITESGQYSLAGEVAGTPTHMAPEQVRGETHRLDGRTDVWALGVILYQALVRRLPFSGLDSASLFDEILHRDPRPPRQIDDAIPKELERICLKCLSKRMNDRYSSAVDLADDLHAWLVSIRPRLAAAGPAAPAAPASPAPGEPATQVVPKGLRSFDREDAEFFLDLLPGPRDRHGLPESIRFWKSRIEDRDGAAAFNVGLLYGPTGCGKSSFIKAGLLPQLGPEIRTIYLEASPSRTEARLLALLRREEPDLPAGLGLAGAAAALRERLAVAPGRKILLVIDQFEQWLHHAPGDPDPELLRALRQCDGLGLQALLLVRDDFWMAVTRFLHDLEVPLVEGANSAAVELFDKTHASRVLANLGRAYGRLPDLPADPGPEATRFLDEAIAELADAEERVIPIRLILLAEMVRYRPWAPKTLRTLGGIEGIGVTYLEETFGERSARLAHRPHLRAAMAVLKALLPAPPSNLKGARQTRRALQEAAGLEGRPEEFDALMGILDHELRMVTPVDSLGVDLVASGVSGPGAEGSYQLTHDYLVPPLRQWLTHKQRETRAGRAEIRLAERAQLWANKPERKQLPSWWEWLAISALTSHAAWSPPERKLMQAASRFHARRALALASAALVALAGWLFIAHRNSRAAARDRALEQVRQLWNIDVRFLPRHLDEMEELPEGWRAWVEERLERADVTPEERARGLLALARRRPVGIDLLAGRLLEAREAERRVIRDELWRWRDRLAPLLWRAFSDGRPGGQKALAAASALAVYDPGGSQWDLAAKATVRDLIAQDPLSVISWVEDLRPARERLRPALIAAFDDPDIDESRRPLVASILADFAAADPSYLDPATLADLLMGAGRAQFPILLPLASRSGPGLLARLEGVLGQAIPLAPGPERDRLIARKANAAMAQSVLGRGEGIWPLLRQAEDPGLRTRLIGRIGPSLLGREALMGRFATEEDPSVRQSILLTLDAYRPGLDPAERDRLVGTLRSIFETDPDGGVHGAAEWLLVRWGHGQSVREARERLAGQPPGPRRWFITKRLHTMLIIDPPGAFSIGSPDHEVGRDKKEQLRQATIDHRFAISAHEVTLEEYRAFSAESTVEKKVTPEADCPVNFTRWYDAARYCRWAGEQEEGNPEADLCYPPISEIGPGMKLPEGYLRKGGYRLPTEVEWEYVARAGSATRWSFGESEADLDLFAWTSRNSDEHTWPVGRLRPNPFGLFDIYGNVNEWCDAGIADRDVDQVKIAIRGGNYRDTPKFLRSAMLTKTSPMNHLSTDGFRIVKPLPDPTPDRAGPETPTPP
ncbi:protein kinase domain-containing protein [Tundrisphaera sp. TA3]|uniref:protein kinase domain-containing protein n=1 Tax=Tundrisphaera sp. TA3 TaxID=3435775 RepID=UPI003EBC4E37